MKRMRKKAVLDYVQWTDDRLSRAVAIDGVLRQGNWATLHDPRPRSLVLLPSTVLKRPIAGLEFSIDLVAKKAGTDAEQLEELSAVYDLLHRRLAPWKGRFLTPGVRRSYARGQKDVMIKYRAPTEAELKGTVLLREAWPKVRLPIRRDGRKLVRAHTVYFGDKPDPSWSNLPTPPAPCAQVKLYLKVTDDGADLPRNKWRVRMEVTLNAAAIVEVLGVATLHDLQHADMRTLVNEYLRLTSPQPAPPKVRMPSTVIGAMLISQLRKRAVQDAAAAVRNGNFTQLEEGMITFAPVQDLDRSILAAAGEFQRAMRRAKRWELHLSV
jgi:hypothetical protein